MTRKIVVLAMLALTGVFVVGVASAVTVFALVGDSAPQADEIQVEEAVEVAPLRDAPSQVEVVEPVLRYEKADYAAGSGGCPYSHSVKAQLTEAPTQKLETEPLAQVDP